MDTDTDTGTTNLAPLAQLRAANEQDWTSVMRNGSTANPSTARLMHALAASLLGHQDVARRVLADGPYEGDWPVLSGRSLAEQALAQAIHDMLGVLGFDLDGDPTPAALLAGMGVEGYARSAVADAQRHRRDEDEADQEYASLERITRGLYDALSVIVEDPKINLDDDPKAVEQATEARAAYRAAYPSGLLPGVQASDVL